MSPLTKDKVDFGHLWWQPDFECPSPSIPAGQPGPYLRVEQAAQYHPVLSSSLCASFLMLWLMDILSL